LHGNLVEPLAKVLGIGYAASTGNSLNEIVLEW
jgi:hypothetical protein